MCTSKKTTQYREPDPARTAGGTRLSILGCFVLLRAMAVAREQLRDARIYNRVLANVGNRMPELDR
jgi:hypothetical protein